MNTPEINLYAVWIGLLLGMLSGAVIGMAFHNDQWQGGYAGWRRRLMRLGHISFFGLAFVNLVYVQTVDTISDTPDRLVRIAGWALIVAAVAMPTVCFLAAWRKPIRHLFFIPVVAALGGVVLMLINLWGQMP